VARIEPAGVKPANRGQKNREFKYRYRARRDVCTALSRRLRPGGAAGQRRPSRGQQCSPRHVPTHAQTVTKTRHFRAQPRVHWTYGRTAGGNRMRTSGPALSRSRPGTAPFDLVAGRRRPSRGRQYGQQRFPRAGSRAKMWAGAIFIGLRRSRTADAPANRGLLRVRFASPMRPIL
jgi:hypothetical protein